MIMIIILLQIIPFIFWFRTVLAFLMHGLCVLQERAEYIYIFYNWIFGIFFIINFFGRGRENVERQQNLLRIRQIRVYHDLCYFWLGLSPIIIILKKMFTTMLSTFSILLPPPTSSTLKQHQKCSYQSIWLDAYRYWLNSLIFGAKRRSQWLSFRSPVPWMSRKYLFLKRKLAQETSLRIYTYIYV